MRKILLLSLMFLLVSSAAFADFTNGGFEAGDFSGWTLGQGYFYGGSSYNTANYANKSGIVTSGFDPNTNNNLQMVAYGAKAARVNNQDDSYHYSTLTQRATWTADHIYFAWAAVLQEPGNVHPQADAPNFTIMLKDITSGATLYNVSFNVYNALANGINWIKGASNGYDRWYYNQWVIADLDTSGVIGHELELSVRASDCGWGGHGGYAYVDGFSQYLPPPPPRVPLPPSVLLLGSGLVGLVGWRRFRKS